MTIESILERMHGDADAIARAVQEAWSDEADREPGERLPPDLALDHLPELIAAVAAAALKPDDMGARDQVARLGIKHGGHRRREGFGQVVVFREMHLLRRLLWQESRRRYTDGDVLTGAALRIDRVLTLALSASLRGHEAGDTPVPDDVVRRLVLI